MTESESKKIEKVVTRFAPSPTGFMHVGGVRTALYAWLWARKNKGTFILRIEDTDKERSVEGSMEHIMESLKWLGLDWDEGPDNGGPHQPYIQSQRLDLYKKYALVLIDKGLAYPDPYSEKEVDIYRKNAEIEKRAFLFRDHRPANFWKWDGTRPLRFKVPTIKSYEWHDLVFGDLSAGAEALDDFILIKSDGYPTYNFAHIVDDIEMGVTHVMRGEEFISSTPKYLSVYEAFGIAPPKYATLPLILGSDGKKKLSKRDGAKDLLEYRDDGYLPDAFINFLALLGWNVGDNKEIFTREELIEAFDIERVHKSGAAMSMDKLDWINK
ncbi:MAG: glutamate--tRNA ligase [Candidatus Paceibacterota bacterium]